MSRTSRLFVAASLCAVLSMGLCHRADAAIALYSTGMASPVGSPSTPLVGGAIDTHYTLVSAPSGVPLPSTYVTVVDGFPSGSWAANSTGSKWIEPTSGMTDNHPVGLYAIETNFSLAGYDATTAAISLLLGSDNRVRVFLNGVDTGINQVGFGSLTPFVLSSGFVAGNNTLRFELTNDSGSTGNPTGLRVEYTSVTAAAVPEMGTFGIWGALSGLGMVLVRKRRS